MDMRIEDLLSRNKPAILDRWIELTLASYPGEAARLFKEQKGPFSNPVGHTISRGLKSILEALLEHAEPEALMAELDPVIRIRAGQDFPPSRSVDFLFLLKRAIREELHKKPDHEIRQRGVQNGFTSQLLDFEARIDETALLAFDGYTRCREEIARLRIDELKRLTYMKLKLAGGIDPESAPEPESTEIK